MGLDSEAREWIGRIDRGRGYDIPMLADQASLNPEKVGDRISGRSVRGGKARVNRDQFAIAGDPKNFPTRIGQVRDQRFKEGDGAFAISGRDVGLMLNEIGGHEALERRADLLFDKPQRIEALDEPVGLASRYRWRRGH